MSENALVGILVVFVVASFAAIGYLYNRDEEREKDCTKLCEHVGQYFEETDGTTCFCRVPGMAFKLSGK